MPRLSPTPGTHKEFNSGPFSFDIEIGDETGSASVYALIYADNIRSEDLTVKLNGSVAGFKKATDDGLYIFEVNHSSVKSGINELYIDIEKPGQGQVLKDAAIFFCRDKDDLEMRELIAILQPFYLAFVLSEAYFIDQVDYVISAGLADRKSVV